MRLGLKTSKIRLVFRTFDRSAIHQGEYLMKTFRNVFSIFIFAFALTVPMTGFGEEVGTFAWGGANVGEAVTDAVATAEIATAQTADAEFATAMNSEIQRLTQAASVVMTTASEEKDLPTVYNCEATIQAFQKIQSAVSSYRAPKKSCSESSAKAKNFCSMVRSPEAQNVGSAMTVGAAVLQSITSASETCGKSADLSKMGQAGMTAANALCSAQKTTCDSSCASSSELLKQMLADAKLANSCVGTSSLVNKINSEDSSRVQPKIVQCQQHVADMATFAAQAASLGTAMMQAKDCQQKLTAGAGANALASKTITTDEMCREPGNAQLSVCKCKADMSAQGCPGAIAKSNAPMVKSTGSGNQLAGMGSFRQQTGGLSDAARTALGIDSNAIPKDKLSDEKPTGSGFGAAGASDSAGALGGSKAAASDKLAGDAKEKGKLNLGAFTGAMSNFFGGGNNKNSNSAKYGEAKIAEAKRQIASQQLKTEVSAASGKSNWDKVRTRYVENSRSFFGQ